ncbi:heat shock protein Hsp15 [Tranquillimonas rosea]|uniref:Heat shock protein Hsp15 n=1 Tax=Tranquillimonas rosea TaxID=641238 RepID=A0A1H9V299_9RHOB|nr:RNA-binding S4 domain-containing protein [Tranquillimonas rosea]SES15494.1 heat shock protein Hsp15 [Tranquillimonas rosea]
MGDPAEEPARIRLDKWLYFARFFKTRALAAKVVTAGQVRVNATRVSKPSRSVGPGDVLTFPQARAVRVVRIRAAGERRGPAPEAQTLYEDLSPEPRRDGTEPRREAGGRPTKKARRNMLPKSGPPLE